MICLSPPYPRVRRRSKNSDPCAAVAALCHSSWPPPRSPFTNRISSSLPRPLNWSLIEQERDEIGKKVLRMMDINDDKNASPQQTYTHTHTYRNSQTLTHTQTRTDTHARVRTRKHTHMPTHTHTHNNNNTHLHTHTHTHTHTYTHTYTHTHTHLHCNYLKNIMCKYLQTYIMCKYLQTLIDQLELSDRPFQRVKKFKKYGCPL